MNKYALQNYMDNTDSLPEMAFGLLPSNHREVILVKKGIKGYFPYHIYDNEKVAKETVEFGNSKLGVSEEQAEALLLCSMRQN